MEEEFEMSKKLFLAVVVYIVLMMIPAGVTVYYINFELIPDFFFYRPDECYVYDEYESEGIVYGITRDICGTPFLGLLLFSFVSAVWLFSPLFALAYVIKKRNVEE